MTEPAGVLWVLGGGGLLGRHVVVAAENAGYTVLTSEVPWDDRDETVSVLTAGVDALREAAGGGAWSVAWCAGAGVVATPQEHFETEVEVFRAFLDRLAGLGPGGSFFLASSAGGVYAGSPDRPPYTEDSTTAALAPYGKAKLAMESIAAEFAGRSGTKVLIGRLSNLYGPGQNLSKPQGLVSMLCQALVSGQPAGVYVSMDTLRDYLFVHDAARMVVAGLERVAAQEQPVVTKIFASGRGTSIAALVGVATKVFRRRPPIVFRASAVSSAQVRDLRLSSVVWPDLDALARTTLPVGLATTGQSIVRADARPRITSHS